MAMRSTVSRNRVRSFFFDVFQNIKSDAAVFNNPNAAYNKEADVRSFASMVALFEEKLKQWTLPTLKPLLMHELLIRFASFIKSELFIEDYAYH